MLFTTQRPGSTLAPDVDFFWFYEGLSPAHTLERVLPDGTFELIVNLREEPRHLYDRTSHRPAQSFRRGWVSGAHSRFIVIDTAPDSSMIGAHFKPGGAARFLGMPASELSDRVVPLDALWGSAGTRLREALLEAPTPLRKFLVLQQFLEGRGRATAGGRNLALDHSLRRLSLQPHVASIGQLAGELGVSHKHLIECFRRMTGLTPKRFCRIRRFQEVLRQIETRRPVEWADLAIACGYFDQAHFIHDFQAFAGLNPSAYLTQRGEHLNFVPLDS